VKRSSIGLVWLGLPLLAACGPGSPAHGPGTGGSNGSGGQGGSPGPSFFIGPTNSQLDLLFVIDNGSGADLPQQKLVAQVPALLQALQAQAGPSLDLHVGVVSTDMGAPGDVTAQIGCTTMGDNGALQTSPRGLCAASPLAQGQTFLTSAPGTQNFSGTLSDAVSCILPLGHSGCGFKQTLSALSQALDLGVLLPDPTAFVRTNAALAIVILSTEDDCSALEGLGTSLYSLNGGPQSVTNALGPIAKYRCSQFGLLCSDPATGQTGISPPLAVPADATGTPPTLSLTGCASNDGASSMLTSVTRLISVLRSRKLLPDDQIFVGSIVAPASPYTVTWTPPPSPTAQNQNELWPSVLLSCGPAGGANVNPAATDLTMDGSTGAPAVRITQLGEGFPRHLQGAICDASYAPSMTAFGTAIGAMVAGTACAPDSTPLDAQGQPLCTVSQLTMTSSGSRQTTSVPNCAANGNAVPCWTAALDRNPAACTGRPGSRPISVSPVPGGSTLGYNVTCTP
jgi:hypothetical protein